MNKEECEKACLYLLGHCYEEKEIEDGLYEFKPSGFKESEIFKELINKYFELKEKLEKNCLVSNMARDIEKLEKALDKACEELEKLDESHAYECNKQIIEKKGSSTITFGYQTKGEWKEYLLKEVKEDD